MNIGDVAKASGLPPKTIRYYEDIGLIAPHRGDNGYRAFSDKDLHLLAFIARARGLGFSIEDVRALLSLWQDRARASGDVKRVAQEHLTAIDAKMRELSAMRDTLAGLVADCHGDDRPDCPILNGLATPPPGHEGCDPGP
jgi:Cu(I)-responsive transcriptional regulator